LPIIPETANLFPHFLQAVEFSAVMVSHASVR
jgi:hypothetical protein